jgi:transketolase
MRQAFCQAMISLYKQNPFVFLTGDLGFMALEPLRDVMAERFINAGIAEQNMIGVAAGMARTGHSVWAYSIAPFIYARPLEQIRNDICLHGLPVKLVGNGGGYGYGVMGGTHHALEDYGILLTLQGMRVYIPAFREDMAPMIDRMRRESSPAYLRLGRCEKPANAALPPYAPWRCVLKGKAGLCITAGAVAGPLWDAFLKLAETDRPALWLVSELPFAWHDIPKELAEQFSASCRIVVVEEHVRHGGVGQMLATILIEHGLTPGHFSILSAQGYPSGLYGSQFFSRQESHLTPEAVLTALTSL